MISQPDMKIYILIIKHYYVKEVRKSHISGADLDAAASSIEVAQPCQSRIVRCDPNGFIELRAGLVVAMIGLTLEVSIDSA